MLGMFHLLYFTGTSPVILVIGGTFSTLELMPLVMVGFKACENLSMTQGTSWIQHYKWPVPSSWPRAHGTWWERA